MQPEFTYDSKDRVIIHGTRCFIININLDRPVRELAARDDAQIIIAEVPPEEVPPEVDAFVRSLANGKER